jgi:hypothetical protein
MNNRKLIILAIVVLALAAFGCEGGVGFRTVQGSGTVEEKTYEVSDFTSVELATVGRLVVELGETETLRVQAEDNLIKYFEVEVRNGLLEIGGQKNVNLIPTEGVYFYLTVKELDTLVISGLGSVELPEMDVPKFSIEISGGGSVDVDGLNGDAIEAEISGLGDLSIDGGEVDEQDIVITGGGNYRARNLQSARAEVDIDGLGSATVRVSEHLGVTISGGGAVEYFGDPSVDQDVSGLGHVRKIGD